MPKPFKESLRCARDAIKERPQLLNHIGIIATMWTHVDHSLGLLLSRILDTEAVVGTAMYFSLIGEKACDAAMKAATEVKLSPNLNTKFIELMNATKLPRKDRNKIVHGLWAISDQRPDSLVLCDQKERANMYSYIYQGIVGKELEKAKNDHWSSLIEFEETDFIKIEEQISEVLDKIDAFTEELSQFKKKC